MDIDRILLLAQRIGNKNGNARGDHETMTRETADIEQTFRVLGEIGTKGKFTMGNRTREISI